MFTGILAAERSKLDRAVGHVERALALDPETEATWTHRASALKELDARHRAQLGTPLP